ncbi:hypothetical protein AMIS_58230 [Actinoplanes missouriensis 431]|uniref:Integral membrane protein n=1 Tax=Actinoplanes missouriensis (strain ATCC 14538 / DSM 43046 / CBS 188.64 / JCM 3121 / NBRC 102363 / NCIMB 12654 / NRRL B-3342 / UNCC 431) TaxID=512565 RepID=I0HDF6_ACTM4|nr:hypothetical protein [Actinoplanes missouriensis]BAL91043.1 hypothetical protein AMIS_58230 [Actinoplanes missouriensis 431]
MTTAGWMALGLAVYGALSYAVGSILQAVGAKRSHNTVSTLGHPLYLIGIALDISAWVAAMFALQHLAVYVVESVLAGSLAVTAVLAWLFLRSRLRHRDVAAIVCTSVALTTLAMSAGQQHEMTPTWTMRVGFCCAAVGVVILGWMTTRIGIPGLIAGVGGLSLGGAALTGRVLTMPPGSMDTFPSAVVAIATEPLVWALLIFPINGMILYANALQQGDVGRVTAVHWTGEVVAPSVIALTLLGDTVRPGWEPAALLAGIVTIGAAVVLASAPATVAVESADGSPAPAGTTVAVPPQSGLGLVPVEAWRLAIPPEAHWPALQPPLVRGYGTFRWWGSPTTPQPLWVPPDRTLNVPGSVPAWAGPQLPEARRPSLPEARGSRAAPRGGSRRKSGRHALPSGRRSSAA